MKTKYDIYDIVVYNKQGVYTADTIVEISVNPSGHLYHLASNVVILEDNVVTLLGNLKKIISGHEEILNE